MAANVPGNQPSSSRLLFAWSSGEFFVVCLFAYLATQAAVDGHVAYEPDDGVHGEHGRARARRWSAQACSSL